MKTHRGYYLYILFIVTSIGFILRVRHLNYHSLWLDEILQVMVASAEWGNLFSLVSSHSSPPLDYILLKCVIAIFGTADWVVRMPALLFGAASLPVFYFLVVGLTNRQHALIATILLAFSPMAILYSQEARMYSLFLFLSLISYAVTLLLIKKNDLKTGLFLSVVNGVLILTHYFGIFVIVMEATLLTGLLLCNADKKRRAELIVINLLLAFFIFLPWLPSFLSAQVDMEIPYALGADSRFFKSILLFFTTLGGKPDAWFYSYMLTFMIGAILAFRTNEKRVMIVVVSVVGMLSILFGVAFFKKIVTERNLIFLLPLFLFVCAYGVNAFLTYLKITPIVGTLIVAFLLFWPGYRDHSSYRKVNWRGAAQYIQQHLGKGERVITTDFISRASLAYYLVPEAEYVLMRKQWRETTNNPQWKIWVINDELIKKIQEQRFSGWAVIPPVTFRLVSIETLDSYNDMMGHPVKQFQLGQRPLNIYYLRSTMH